VVKTNDARRSVQCRDASPPKLTVIEEGERRRIPACSGPPGLPGSGSWCADRPGSARASVLVSTLLCTTWMRGVEVHCALCDIGRSTRIISRTTRTGYPDGPDRSSNEDVGKLLIARALIAKESWCSRDRRHGLPASPAGNRLTDFAEYLGGRRQAESLWSRRPSDRRRLDYASRHHRKHHGSLRHHRRTRRRNPPSKPSTRSDVPQERLT
jgi:hypothetical protein